MSDINIENIVSEIQAEAVDSSKRHVSFRSEHEGLGVIREKYKGLEAEIFSSDRFGAFTRMRDDAVQLAVNAIRLISFIDTTPRKERKGRLLFNQDDSAAETSS